MHRSLTEDKKMAQQIYIYRCKWRLQIRELALLFFYLQVNCTKGIKRVE